MDIVTSNIKEVIIPLQSGPQVYTVDETGYGFAVEQCDDQSSILQVNGTQGDPFSLVEVSKLVFPRQFQKLYITNFEQIPTGVQLEIKLLIIKDPTVQITAMAPYRDIANALTLAQLYMLQASGSTTRYAIWQVDASSTEPSTYIDQNQDYFPNVPLIQYIQPLSLASGSAFELATSAMTDPLTTNTELQSPISSSFYNVKDVIPLMGYSVVYTPTATASGTNTFLIGIQQPLSTPQLKELYALMI